MWIFTKVGFFSVVQADRRGREPPRLMVRARVRLDLDELRRTYAPELGDTVESAGTDYPYRAFIAPAAWGKVMERIGRDVDYRNFKDTVERQQGRARHDLYARVWEVMYAAERKLEGATARRARPPNPFYEEVGEARRASPRTPVRDEREECRSCIGYGYFRPDGEPTVDRRERKCLDCGGEGKVPRRAKKRGGG